MIWEVMCVVLIDGLSAEGRLVTADPKQIGLEALRNGSGFRGEDVLVIVGGLLTLLSGISLIGWLRKQRIRPHALVVFNRIAREAGLTVADRRLLWRIGRSTGSPTPLTLMLCPGTLGYAARQHARSRSKRRGSHELAHAASVRRHLFGPNAKPGD